MTSIDACTHSLFGPFQKPLYDSYCFSRIPSTIQKLLGMQTLDALPEGVTAHDEYDYVIAFLLDAFGWTLFERHKEKYPFLKRFVEEGTVSMLTSQFPSTTTPHVTCMHTGLPVGKTGIYEWFCYDPIVDASITPLRFSFAKDRKANSLLDAGYSPKELFPFPSIYRSLKKNGIHSYIFQTKDVTYSPYSQTLQEGAVTHAYKSLREGLNKLHRVYHETKAEKAYFFFYYPQIDSYGHEYGPLALQTDKEIEHTFQLLERWLENLGTIRPKTACILFADHGMVTIDPAKTIYLNHVLPELLPLIKNNRAGMPIVPCGSCRDFFLHVDPIALPIIKEVVQEKAEVYSIDYLVKQGLFGEVTDRFLERVGNVVVLPHPPYSVWWYEKGIFENSYFGHHGGLTKDELLIPFLFRPL